MTNKDMFVSFGGIKPEYVLMAAPSEKILNGKIGKTEKADAENPKAHNKALWLKLGAFAAALILLICAVPMVLELIADDFTPNTYDDVLVMSDLAVFGTYKGKTEKLTYSEYTFEVTEVLKGEVEQKEITVRSEKKSIFSEDEMEKHAQSVNASFEEGVEYFLTLQGNVDDTVEFISEQIIETANMVNAGSRYDELKAFLTENGVELNSTRDELKAFWEYIFSGIILDEDGEHVEENLSVGLVFDLNKEGMYYNVTKYMGNAKIVVIPTEYNGLPVKNIADVAFRNCSFENVVISDGIERIGASAFEGCQNLNSVIIPDTVSEIGNAAFRECAALKRVHIPEKVTVIQSSLFENCISLVNVTLSSNTITIGQNAFYYCSSLIEIDIPDKVCLIYEGAFSYCKSLKSVVLPKSIKNFYITDTIYSGVFDGCESLEAISISKENEKFYSINNCIIERSNKTLVIGCKTSVIPNDGSVQRIGNVAFAGMTGIQSIQLPDCLISIGNRAFAGTGLSEIIIPKYTTEIGEGAFMGCNNLKSVTILSDLKQISRSMFEYCSKLPSVTIPESVVVINDRAFEGCQNMTELYIPKNVSTIGKRVFAKCTSLTEVEIPSNVVSIGDGIFSGCTNLNKIILPNTITTIPVNAFQYCDELTHIELPESIYMINPGAFSSCRGLKSIGIPGVVAMMQGEVFEFCSLLTDIYFGGTVEKWNVMTGNMKFKGMRKFTVHCLDGDVVIDKTT